MSSAATTPAAVVAEAMTWLHTPWHHMARIKGVGVDCAQFLAAVFEAEGLVPPLDLGYYPADWHLHQDRPRFLEVLALLADPVALANPQPGDIAMFKFGRHAAHGSIVVGWPLIIHAYRDERRVVLSDVAASPALASRLDSVWRVRAPAGEGD